MQGVTYRRHAAFGQHRDYPTDTDNMATKRKPTFSTTSKASNSLMPWLGIAFIVILLDQLSKITILKLFQLGEDKAVTGFFNLTLAYNRGAAFSFLSTQGGWQRYFFTAIAIGAV